MTKVNIIENATAKHSIVYLMFLFIMKHKMKLLFTCARQWIERNEETKLIINYSRFRLTHRLRQN